MSTSLISINNIACVRGERTLFEGLSFDVSEGQLIHITGPNGCGKSSLLRLLCGINQTETGNIQWNNSNIEHNANFAQSLAYIGHKDGLKNELSAFENLKFYQRLNVSANDNATDNGIDAYLNTMGILHCAEQSTYQLSFGQRRRLAFARLLVKPYKLWILDEPFTGIDTEGRELIEKLCHEHLASGGLIILTHHGKLQQASLTNYVKELPLGGRS